MKLERLETRRITIPGTGGAFLTDLANEPKKIRDEAVERSTEILRTMAGTVPLCSDLPPGRAKREATDLIDPSLGSIRFVLWSGDRDPTILGVFLVHDIKPEKLTRRALVCRARMIPAIRPPSSSNLSPPRLMGLVARHLLGSRLRFASGRFFRIVEWEWDDRPGARRFGHAGDPWLEATTKIFETIAGKDAAKKHQRKNQSGNAIRSIRHTNAESLKTTDASLEA